MAVVAVYVSDASEIIVHGHQVCILLYKSEHPIILSEYVCLSSLRVRCPNI